VRRPKWGRMPDVGTGHLKNPEENRMYCSASIHVCRVQSTCVYIHIWLKIEVWTTAFFVFFENVFSSARACALSWLCTRLGRCCELQQIAANPMMIVHVYLRTWTLIWGMFRVQSYIISLYDYVIIKTASLSFLCLFKRLRRGRTTVSNGHGRTSWVL